MWPISSTVVVLPFVPVTAMNSLGEKSPCQLELADRRSIPRERAWAITGACAGTPGTLDERAHTLEQRDSLLAQMKLDTRLHEQLRGLWGADVDAEHLLSPGAQRKRRGDARAGKTHDQIGAGREIGSRLHDNADLTRVRPARAPEIINRRLCR